MSTPKTFFVTFFLLSAAFTEIASWTVDLPEARKYFFDKNIDPDADKNFNITLIKDDLYFDNVVPDSPHNKEEFDEHSEHNLERTKSSENEIFGGRYAEGYEYMSYMEKKVHGIVNNGSAYLEGLRKALEDYGELLSNCSRQNFTQTSSNGPWLPENETPNPGPPFPLTPFEALSQAPNSPNQDTPLASLTNPASNPVTPTNSPSNPLTPTNSPSNTLTLTNSPSNPLSANSTRFSFNRLVNMTVDRETCERANMVSEHVRRLAQLSLWATRELQDRAYNEKFNKDYHHSDDEEEAEAELLLRLAFFLDRLAFYTGYEPQPDGYVTDRPEPTTTTTQKPQSPMGDVPEEVTLAMIRCLQANTTGDAVERCRYPLRHPQFMTRMFNITDPAEIVEGLRAESQLPDAADPSLGEVYRNPMLPNSRQKRQISGGNADPDEFAALDEIKASNDKNLTAESVILTSRRQKQEALEGLAAILNETLVPITESLRQTITPITNWLQNMTLIILPQSFVDLTKLPQNFVNMTYLPQTFTTLTSDIQNLTDNLALGVEQMRGLLSIARVITTKQIEKTPLKNWTQNYSLANLTQSFVNLTTNIKELTNNITSGVEQMRNLITVAQVLKQPPDSLPMGTENNGFINSVEANPHLQKQVELTDRQIDKVLTYAKKETERNDALTHNFEATSRKKRSVNDNPLQHAINYYVKYKTWENLNANTIPEDRKADYDVPNHLTLDKHINIQKRSIGAKKMAHLQPEDPMQDISQYVKTANGVNYVKDDNTKQKLQLYLEKIRKSDSKTSKMYSRKLFKNHRSKRSVNYQKKLLPSKFENPRQDLSFYEKNKVGTDYNNDVVQAGQVRAGLQQVYDTGNILIVQRYGANYNPLIPFPLGSGIVRSTFGDI